jgi:carboxypeptidase D
MNTDGFEAAPEGSCSPNPSILGRRNANLVDLNRNFPDQFHTFGKHNSIDLEGRQPETQNVMKWIVSNYFVLSANLHALTVVASYPFDSVPLEVE